MDNRSTPYIALACGLYDGQEDPIKFATEHLEQINNSTLSGPLVKISTVYQALEIYADQLGAQPVITLPQLTELYALAKNLSDDQTAKAVLTSLAARHLSFKKGISHCQQCHIDDAKNIIASTITFFKQEATVDAMVYIVNCLCKKPSDYQFASTQGQKAEAKKLAGNRLFSTQHKEHIDRIRLLLIAAQNISLQVEDKQLDDSYILFSVKQELLKQGVDEKLANAIAIVTGSSYFLEDPSRIPTAIALEKAAEWLVKSEALINYQANQVSIIKFLQEYFKRNNNSDVVKALATAQALKEDVLLGNSIAGKLKSQGKIAERSWKAFLLVQEYAAEYYFSPMYGGFKINRDDNQGNGFYHAMLTVLKTAFKDDVDHAIHKLTKDNLSQLIKELLPISKGIIVEHFSNIIRGKDNLLSVPNALTEELKLLHSAWLQRNHLSAPSIEILDRDLNNYLETISSRYIEFVNRNPEVGCAIELKIIAHYYEVQIQQHSYLVDYLNVINNNTSKIVHILYAPYQAKYYGLSHQELTASSELSIVDYVKKAVGAVAYIQEPLDFWSLASTVSILAMHNPIVWQANNLDIDVALLKQTIQDAYNATKEACVDNCIKRHEQVFNKTASSNPNIPDEVKEIKRDLSLSPMPREQLALIELEAAYSIADLKWAAVNKAYSNAKTAKPYTMTEEMLVALRKKDTAKIALVEERQIVNNSRYNRAVIDHYEAMFLEELRLRNVAKIEAYTAWWQNLIKEQRNSIATALAEYNKQIDASIQQLTTAYEQQMTVINSHYDDVTHKTIQAYREYERQVEEARRKARRKRRRKIIKTFVSMGIAAFVAPVLAQSMFSAGFGCTVATGVIAGGISSGIAGNNILKGAAMGGLFAGFGCAFDNILGEFIKNSYLLRESLNVAATTSLSTAVYGGKVLDNVLASVGSNVVASLAIPLPQTNPNQAVTKQQLTFIVNRKVARVFTSGMLSSVATKNSDFGMSLMMSGMGAIQSWIGHKANTFVQERRATAPLQRISYPRPTIGINRQNSNSRYTFIPHTSKTNNGKPSTTNSVSSPKPRADRSRVSPVAENQNQALSLSQIYSTKNDSFWSNFNDYLNTYAPTAQTPVQNWKPIFFSDFGNNHKLTPFEGKRGETRYRNVDNGRFDKSPSDLLKKDMSKLDVYSKYNLMLHKKGYSFGGYRDITDRYSSFGYDDAVGLRLYKFVEANSQSLVNKESIQVSLNSRWQTGINVASFEAENSIVKGRVDLSGPIGGIRVTSKTELGKEAVSVYLGGSAVVSLGGVQSKVDFNEYCIDRFCVSPSVMQEIYVGSAIRGELGLQYSNITKKGILILSCGGGLGLPIIPKLNLNFRLRELNSTEDNGVSINRPKL